MVHSANNSGLIDLTQLPSAEHYYIAYSGGIDSTALLHALSLEPQLQAVLTAIHVNHNIHADSKKWAEHCQSTCNQYNIPLISESVQLSHSSEDACRQARLKIFNQHLSAGDCLLTAHHLNDQVETVLFRLFRGTGINGMTGMSPTHKFNHYSLHRPLLSVSQTEIKDYVKQHQLVYIEDPSNQDNRYKRNHIRNLILPALEKYDTQLLNNIELTARNLTHSQQLLNHLIGDINPFDYSTFSDHKLLSTALYHWLQNLNQPIPSHKRLLQFSHDCLQAAEDKNPELQLETYRLTRWRNRVYALLEPIKLIHFEQQLKLSSDQQKIVIPGNGEIYFTAELPVTIPAMIQYQQSHERIQLTQKGPHKKLKNLFQQQAIPPWQRKTIPYLYIDQKLMAVGSTILSYEFKQLLSEYKAEYRWLSPQYIL